MDTNMCDITLLTSTKNLQDNGAPLSRAYAHVSRQPAAPAPCNFVNGISYMTLLIGIFVRCVSALQKKSTFLLNGRSRNIGKSSTLWWRWVIIIKGSHSGIGTIYIPSLIQWSVVSYNINDKTIVYAPVYMLYLPQNIQHNGTICMGTCFLQVSNGGGSIIECTTCAGIYELKCIQIL